MPTFTAYLLLKICKILYNVHVNTNGFKTVEKEIGLLQK